MDKSCIPEWTQEGPWQVRVPRTGGMRVDGLVYASPELMKDIASDASLCQVANVAHLPGIVSRAMAMPDMHWGYGFPIGGVAAFDLADGVVSPGGVGYDINCGVRLLTTNIKAKRLGNRMKELVDQLFRDIPSGVGSRRKDLKLSNAQLEKVLEKGARFVVEEGFGEEGDTDFIEEQGRIDGADPAAVSDKARERGRNQLGTLGSGNHFVEIGVVDRVFDNDVASAFGLREGRLTVMIHTGSRGLGHQVCDDAIRIMLRASQKYGIELPDRQLCAAPLSSPEGARYMASMAAAANFAFANRQLITHWVRQALNKVLGGTVGLHPLYDVAHNIAKIETHDVNGEKRQLCVHRKGATRAFGPGCDDVPEPYRAVGQPVLIPGDMGRYSFVLAGTETAMKETFGSACHGAGRRMSRKRALGAAHGRSIVRELGDKGISVHAASKKTLAEEMPQAYKDVADVVDVVHGAGIARKVARLRPLGVIKG